MRRPRVLEPLRHRDFRLLWIGQTLTLFGSFVSNVAYPFQMLRLGGTAVELGILVSIYASSSLAFLLVGGVVADRFPRRTLLIVTEIGSGVVIGVVALMGMAGVLEIWHLYATYAWFGAATAFSVPALGAIVPDLVPEDVLTAGNAVQGLSRQGARIGGPVVGGFVVAVAGPPAAFAIDALSFFLSAGAIALTRPRPIAREARGSMLREIREGFAFVFSVEWLWVTIFGWSVLAAAFVGAITVALPLLVTRVLAGGAETFGLLSAALGVGEAVGAALIAQVKIRRVGVAMYLFGALAGAGLLLYGLVPSVPGGVVAAVVNGFGFTCFGVLWVTALQVHVPRRLLGRVTSVDWFGGTLLTPVAPVACALLAEARGPESVFLAAGTLIVSLNVLGLALPSIRRLE